MSFKNVTLLFVFIVLLSSVGIKSSFLDYSISFIYLLIFIFSRKKIKSLSSIIDYFPIIMIIAWLYAFFLGLFNGTSFYNIIFNFPGILLVALYFPFSTVSLNKKEIFIIFLIATSIINIYVLYPVFITNTYTLKLGDLMVNRKYYSPSLILQVIAFNTLLIKRGEFKQIDLSNRLIFISKINAILSLIVLLISFSKGFWLSLLGSFFLINAMAAIYYFKKGKIGKVQIFIFFLVVFLVLYIITNFPDFIDSVMLFFSNNAVGNSLRSEQAIYLIKEFSFFGAGLGTPLSSGYMRDVFGYAFELSFYNVIHKFGVFSILLFIPYLYVLYSNLRWIINHNTNFNTIFSISILSYLLAASGNPILFATINVIIFMIWVSQNRNFYNH